MTHSASASGILASLSDELAAAVEAVGQGVVAVHGRRRRPASGLVWSRREVVTASHVLERETDLTITSPDGGALAARLVARELATDLALLEVDTDLQPIARAGGPHHPGELVLAVGRPGTSAPIASLGALSAVGGAWRTAAGGVLETYLRADVALLPGLSGGALATVNGEALGLLNGHLAGADPVALPVAELETIVERLRRGQPARRAYLGVSSQPVPLQASVRERLGLAQTGGLMLLGLESGAPAERAGLLVGDILLTLAGRPIDDGEALQMALGPAAIGHPMRVQVVRAGAVRDLELTPSPRP